MLSQLYPYLLFLHVASALTLFAGEGAGYLAIRSLQHARTAGGVRAAFADSSLAAVLGSYDDRPPASGLVARYRNLLHHFVHQRSRREATTFWTGLGAVRRDAFAALGGFDLHERFEPEQAAGSGADDIERDALLRRIIGDGAGQAGRTEGHGGCVLRDEDLGHALRASLVTPSRMFRSRRATGSPS